MRLSALALAGAGLGVAATGCGVRELNVYVPTRNLDVLFVIDDSSFSAPLLQQNLLHNFPVFMNRLRDPPGLPNLHLAVVSADMGAGDGSIAGCDSTGGKYGIFQRAARGACDATGLDPDATYISDVEGVRNYTGDIADVFACIAPLGGSGCRFAHPLAAAVRALGADGRPPPPENQGFLRPEAFLFVVVVTGEDDCSAPPGSSLFDTTNTAVDSPFGPAGNYRCNEFGHLCNGAKPPRLPPSGNADDSVTLQGCVSAEGAGMLIPVATVAAQIRSLKPFPDQQVLVGAIGGPAAPYTVRWSTAPTGETGPTPHITPSCKGQFATSAAPSVRIAQWAQAFGGNGILLSACGADYTSSFDRIAQLLDQLELARRPN